MISIALGEYPRISIVIRDIQYGVSVSVEMNGEPTPIQCWFYSETIEQTEDFVIVRHSTQLLEVLKEITNNSEFIVDYWFGEE
jgi:hypothetical protein